MSPTTTHFMGAWPKSSDRRSLPFLRLRYSDGDTLAAAESSLWLHADLETPVQIWNQWIRTGWDLSSRFDNQVECTSPISPCVPDRLDVFHPCHRWHPDTGITLFSWGHCKFTCFKAVSLIDITNSIICDPWFFHFFQKFSPYQSCFHKTSHGPIP